MVQRWKSRISISTSRKLYNISMLPIFLCGSACWAITKVDACRIDQRCLRTLIVIEWH